MRAHSGEFIFLVLILALAAGVWACAGSGPALQTDMEDDGTVTQRMTGNEIGLEGEGQYSDFAMGDSEHYIEGQVRYCTLDAGRRVAADGTVAWILFFSYTGPHKLVIERRKSMEILVDGKYKSVLTGEGTPERSENKIEGTWTENYEYVIPDGVLGGIIDANDVLITVTGGEFTLRAFLTEENIERFKEFYETHGGGVE